MNELDRRTPKRGRVDSSSLGGIRRLFQYYFRPSLIGPRYCEERFAFTVLRFLVATIIVWFVLVLICTWNSMPRRWESLFIFERWPDAFRKEFGPAIVTNLVLLWIAATLGCFGLCVFASWIWLHDSFRSGSIWSAYARSLRISVSGFWLFLTLGLVCIAVVAGASLSQARGFDKFAMGSFAAILCSLGVMILWLGRAHRSIPGVAPHHTPVCEGCGYDLSHAPVTGLCPECGMNTESSLVGRHRGDGKWEHRAGLLPWLVTTVSIIFRPARFYSRLRMRTPAASALRFARVHFIVIGLGAALWLFSILVQVFDTLPEESAWAPAFLSVMYGTIVVLVAWVLSRLIAAVVTTTWFACGWLRDGRWCTRIVAYETAFMWVFCAFCGLFFTSLAIFDGWIWKLEERILGYRVYMLGIPPEVLFVWFGILGLIALWLLRYRTILRAIRWSNF